MSIRRVAALPAGVVFVAAFFFGGAAVGCGTTPFAAADPPAPPKITVSETPDS